jgi:TonB family protein
MTPTALAADVVAFSAQLACVIALAGLLSLVVRIDRAGFRYEYWRAVLLFSALLPWLQPRLPSPQADDVAAIAARALPSTAMLYTLSVDVVANGSGVAWLQVAVWIALAGIVLRLAHVGLGLVRLGRLRRSGRIASTDTWHDDMQRALGTRAQIRYVPDGQPVTCGAWRPVVLLPELLTSQPPDIQRSVVAHELLHVRRRDWIWVVGEEVLRAVLWFHPGIWWLVARVRLAREEAVDELAVRITGQRRAYLEALLAFADAAPFAPGAAFGRRRHLYRRMTLISKEAIMSSRRIAFSLAVLVFGVVAGSWYAVSAFPLMQAPGVIQPAASPSPASEPGPLERAAKPITPENPIPRRTYSVMPKNPQGDSSAPRAVTLRVTINALGRVGEARVVGTQMASNTPYTPPSDVFVRAAIDAVRQWVYDPPADAPISFNVTFLFAPGSDPRLVAHGTPLPDAGVSGGAADGVVRIAPPPPPPPPPWIREGATTTAPVRVGGNIRPPTKVKDVRPVYPPEAQSDRVQGVVILEAVIGPDGRVDRLAVLRSIPQLDHAAIDAVKEWEFTPTLLNGTPVPVIMTVTVNFSLS